MSSVDNEYYEYLMSQDKSDLAIQIMNLETSSSNNRIAESIKENDQLKQQLAEKEKEIEQLNACVKFYKSYYISFNEKVIDELEKVKNYMITNEKDMFGANYLMNSGYVLEFIDNQINELKGEK